uniref:Si:ch211-212d10.1 n=1 Tax=Cyprinus carpio TaxID=7962 RepID=A0A8C2I546_CYPCA
MHDDIVGGKVNSEYGSPYLAARRFIANLSFFCHFSHLMVYLGVYDTNFLPDGIEVDTIPHPEFNMNRIGHDIMLLKLKTPATSKKIAVTITLPNPENEEISKDCMVMGWGWKNYHDKSPSNVLQEANVTLIDSENCGTADILCTEGSTGPALGDSGGPLVCGGVAQGIVSFSKNKTNANYLAGYTRISHYLPWIQSIMMSPTTQKKTYANKHRVLKTGVKNFIALICHSQAF